MRFSPKFITRFEVPLLLFLTTLCWLIWGVVTRPKRLVDVATLVPPCFRQILLARELAAALVWSQPVPQARVLSIANAMKPLCTQTPRLQSFLYSGFPLPSLRQRLCA